MIKYIEVIIQKDKYRPNTYKHCHVFQWLRRGFRLVNQFIGSSLVVTAITSYTLEITVIIAHVKSHTSSSNSSPDHTAFPLELRNTSEVNSHSRIISYLLGTDQPHKTQFYCCVTQTTQKTSHVIAISPVHWRADGCLATSYKYVLLLRARIAGCLSSRCLIVRRQVTI
jgi:hypothetical protein